MKNTTQLVLPTFKISAESKSKITFDANVFCHYQCRGRTGTFTKIVFCCYVGRYKKPKRDVLVTSIVLKFLLVVLKTFLSNAVLKQEALSPYGVYIFSFLVRIAGKNCIIIATMGHIKLFVEVTATTYICSISFQFNLL